MGDEWDLIGAAIDLLSDIHDAWIDARNRRRAQENETDSETEGNES